jgi:hypothetical protein
MEETYVEVEPTWLYGRDRVRFSKTLRRGERIWKEVKRHLTNMMICAKNNIRRTIVKSTLKLHF